MSADRAGTGLVASSARRPAGARRLPATAPTRSASSSAATPGRASRHRRHRARRHPQQPPLLGREAHRDRPQGGELPDPVAGIGRHRNGRRARRPRRDQAAEDTIESGFTCGGRRRYHRRGSPSRYSRGNEEPVHPRRSTSRRSAGRPSRPSSSRQLPPPAWVIDGVLQADSLAEVYGKPGCGKPFIIVDQAQSRHWPVPAVAPRPSFGPVVYVLAEGATGMGARIEAWEERHAIDLHARRAVNPDERHVIWLPMAVNLGCRVGRGHRRVRRRARRQARRVRHPARNTVGVEENSATEMGQRCRQPRRCPPDLQRGCCSSTTPTPSATSPAVDRHRGRRRHRDQRQEGRRRHHGQGREAEERPRRHELAVPAEPVADLDRARPRSTHDPGDHRSRPEDARHPPEHLHRRARLIHPVGRGRRGNKATVARQAKQLVAHGLVVKEGSGYRPVEEPQEDATNAAAYPGRACRSQVARGRSRDTPRATS